MSEGKRLTWYMATTVVLFSPLMILGIMARFVWWGLEAGWSGGHDIMSAIIKNGEKGAANEP